jgi:hypothetical protein
VHGSNDLFVASYAISTTSPYYPTLNWVTQVGAGVGFSIYGQSIAADSSGNIYASGYTNGTPGTQTGAHGVQDAVVVKLNSAGAVLGTKQIGAALATTNGLGISQLYNLGGVESTNIAIPNGMSTGFSTGYLGGTQLGTHSSSGDMILFRFDSSGGITP